MNWSQRYAFKSYCKSALWIAPFLAFVLFFLMIRLLSTLDEELGWTWRWKVEPSGAQAVLPSIIAVLLSLIVFTFGSLLVAIQVASAQLTPRIIATTLLRDDRLRWIVGVFIFTLLFAMGVLLRAQTSVPYLLLTIAGALGAASIVAFLYLIDYAARLLRPVTIVWRVGEEGLKVIERVYPRTLDDRVSLPQQPLGDPARAIDHEGTSAIILAVNIDALVRETQRVDGIIESVHCVGDFVAIGEPPFRLYGNFAETDDRKLRHLVAFGPERTIEQDATFAFRIIVDVAIKALSKAINDPTTAVVAIDQLHRLLRVAGKRHLHEDAVRDSTGQVRLILHTPNWTDLLQLSCREIRLYAAENFQIARRLHALLENLLRTLPQQRFPALRQELELLDLMVSKVYVLPQDAQLAVIPDLQGLGGRQARILPGRTKQAPWLRGTKESLTLLRKMGAAIKAPCWALGRVR